MRRLRIDLILYRYSEILDYHNVDNANAEEAAANGEPIAQDA